MTIARAHLVDPAVTRWYHCVTRCVRRAFLLGEGMHDRKSWIEHRLEELAEIFAVAVAGFAILDNHLHLLVRLDPDVARGCRFHFTLPETMAIIQRPCRIHGELDHGRNALVPLHRLFLRRRLSDQ